MTSVDTGPNPGGPEPGRPENPGRTAGPGRAAGPDRAEEPADDGYPGRLLATVLLAVISFSASMTIVSASLSVIAASLNSTAATLSWSVTGLFLAMAVSTPIMGKLGDSLGHRRVFLTGAVILTLGTILCGLAPTAGAFIAFRVLVGLGISCTMPNGMALILDAFPVERRPVAMGWFQMAMTGAPVIGLVIGGPMIEAWGWRTVFALLSPIATAGLIAAWRVIRSPEPDADGARSTVPIDWVGAGLLGTGVLSFLIGLEQLRTPGRFWFVALTALAAVALLAFIAVERRVEHPLLRLDYFARRNFTGPLIAQPLAQFAYMGGFLIIPLLLGDVLGLGVREIALILVARPGAYSLASPLGGRLATTFGQRTMILTGSGLMVASMLTFAGAAIASSIVLVIIGNLLSGLAMGVASPSYSTTIAEAVEPADLGVANGMGATVMNIGMLTGIQAMFVALGDGRAPADFRNVFLLGAVVAGCSIFGGLLVRRRETGPPTPAPAR